MAKPTLVPLTARELMSLHGLTVEQGLRQGYCIEGHVEEYCKAHCTALKQEQRALKNHGYGYNRYRDRYKHREKPDKPAASETIIKEENYIMEKDKRITLLLCLMESTLFNTMEQTEKAALLTELLYEEKSAAVSAKRPGGRPKKNAAAKQNEEGEAV